jgi:cytochrome c551/c552
MPTFRKIKLLIILLPLFVTTLFSQKAPVENEYYKIAKIAIPEGIVLEVGGLVTMPNGDLAASTRRGDVYIIENPSADKPHFRKFATGLHEILGLAYKNDHLYCAQRGELTRLSDTNGDGKADNYETIASWPISGHYHEYSFGPKVGPDGAFYVTGNVGFGASDWWAGKSFVPNRGWTMRINEDGTVEKYAAGMRSPCGIGMIGGDFFYGDNQGDWMGSGFISHVEKGDFMGHPASLEWASTADSPVKMRKEIIFAKVDPKDDPKKKPEYVKEEAMTTIYEMAKNNPNMGIKSPAVWLPHGLLGVSTSEIITDDTKGAFGPFGGQVFVGDQGMSKIARVFLEKVNGRYQGASFDFLSGFRSGVLRMSWAGDGAMYVGGTNRGWGSTGKEDFGLERLIFAGNMPFEMKTVKAMPDGFEIEFTKEVDKKLAENVNSYDVSSYTYKYHPVYGSPMVDIKENPVRGAKLANDNKTVRLVIDGLREGYVHEIKPVNVVSNDDKLNLLHGSAYYTLNTIPAGEKANITLVTPKPKAKKAKEDIGNKVNTPDNQKKEAAPSTAGEKGKGAKVSVISDKEATAILTRNTCLACHKKEERSVGPSYREVAARKYSNAKIVQLIYKPEPQNWPELTPMAPMTNMPKAEAAKIAAWINSL